MYDYHFSFEFSLKKSKCLYIIIKFLYRDIIFDFEVDDNENLYI